MAHIGVQSSFFFFKICSQWLWMCHQCNHEQDRTGFISLFQQGQCLVFLVPTTCDRDVSKTKSVGKLLLNRVWHTNLATTTWHYFWQGAGIECFKWASGQPRTALQKKMLLWRVWNIVVNVALFCQTPAGFSWICWVIRVESALSSHAFRWLPLLCLFWGKRNIALSSCFLRVSYRYHHWR